MKVGSLKPFVNTNVALKYCRTGPQPSKSASVSEETRVDIIGRRASILGLCSLLAVQPAIAAWDGESSAVGSCPLGDAGVSCRANQLAADRSKLIKYTDAVDNSQKIGQALGVGQKDTAYSKETSELADKLRQLFEVDSYSPQRVSLVKEVKVSGSKWVSKFARGGSAQTKSAKRMYIVVDAVQGWVASNGLAPIPQSKILKLTESLKEAETLLAEGK